MNPIPTEGHKFRGIVEGILAVGALLAMFWGAFQFTENYYAKRKELLASETRAYTTKLRIEQSILERDLKKTAETAHYYRSLKTDRQAQGLDLTPAEATRLDYLERQVEVKQAEVEVQEAYVHAAERAQVNGNGQ